MTDLWSLLLMLVLLAGNAFFVGAEFSIISARRDRLESLASQGRRRAKTVIHASEHLSMMLAGAQLGITICSILLGRIAEPAVAHILERPMDSMGVPADVQHPIAFVIALLIVAFLHILFGEMVPKNIAIAGPERMAMILVPAHLAFMKVMSPLIRFYNLSANLVLRVFGVHPKDELDATVSMMELSEIIGESRMEGLLDAEEHRRLTRALTTIDKTVGQVMIPAAQVRTVPMAPGGPTLGSVEDAVTATGFSRYPVRAAGGRLAGYLHVKDILDLMLDPTTTPSTHIPVSEVRPLPRVPHDLPLDQALTLLRRTHSHLGAVTRRVGDTGPARMVGIVAMEDLAEEFVGTVRDATHRYEPPLPENPA
ncbi:hemolysin family protein [Tomitella cavernea]|uniref:Hemolysin family protein n=1 Tax=Tomitella cavernea TaxID=1387982 RepID=A0ABP9CNQ8_9ACTN|nr:hemolysin family protein [Tomitella cavernea]